MTEKVTTEPNVVWELRDRNGAVGARAIMDAKGNVHLEIAPGAFETVTFQGGEDCPLGGGFGGNDQWSCDCGTANHEMRSRCRSCGKAR